MTCLQMLCQLLAKIFNLSQVIEDEMIMGSGVCLANAIFENVKDVGPTVIPGILQIYLGQIQQTLCSDVQKMLMQGIMTAFWYDFSTTLGCLEQYNATSFIVQKSLEMTSDLEHDHEVKKFMLGMTAMLVSPTQATLPECMQQNMSNIM